MNQWFIKLHVFSAIIPRSTNRMGTFCMTCKKLYQFLREPKCLLAPSRRVAYRLLAVKDMLSVILLTCSVRHISSLPSAAWCAGRRHPSYSLAPCTCCKHKEYCRECQLGSKHWDCATDTIGYIQHHNCEYSPTQLIAYHKIAYIG